jgi:hypothetical protein
LVDFPELWDYTRTPYQVPGVAETVHFDHIKTHYYGGHRTINPTRVVAAGPRVDMRADSARFSKARCLTRNDSAQPRGKAGAASYARRARRFADPYDGFG